MLLFFFVLSYCCCSGAFLVVVVFFSTESKLEFKEVRLNKVLTYSCSFPYLSLTRIEWEKNIYSNAPLKKKKVCIYIIDSLTSFLGGRF